jgi:hypothetical protein
MKAYIDVGNAQLVTIGFQPDLARELMLLFGLNDWGWVDESNRAIPASWELVWVDDTLLTSPMSDATIGTR